MATEVPKISEKGVLERRSHLEIRMDMLRAVQAGAEGPTQIMYKANVSWFTLREHLRALVEKGFLGENLVGNRRKYTLTAKGVDVLDSYLRIEEEMTARIPGIRATNGLE
jgi:predicted transcriptional regulator